MVTEIGRRQVLALLGSSVGAWPISTAAEQAVPMRRIGILSGLTLINRCFFLGLRDAGWLEDENVIIDRHWYGGELSKLAPGVSELMGTRLDVIVTTGTPATLAVKRATQDIPVVFVTVGDPVASGIVESLARPGANITGVSNFLPAASGKLLELLRAFAPRASHIGVLYNSDNPITVLEFRELQIVGQSFSISLEQLVVRSFDDFPHAFKAAVSMNIDAIVTLHEGVTFNNLSHIVNFAQERRLPAIYQLRDYAEAGGLISYGLNYCDHFRRAAYYVDKILRGAKPRDLPVELPTQIELVINLRTARNLGIEVPLALLARADEVIE
jgi:putative tryptophan/tyrosine transport system substrate-binding protein